MVSHDEPGPFVEHKGLVYSLPERGLTLDLFLPEGAAGPVPCVIAIQGGGFAPQDGQGFRPFAVYAAEHGFAAALPAYRGRPEHRYMDTLGDVKAAVRFVRKVSAQYGIAPDRIGAMGRSAGGTLAALLAVTGDRPEFEGDGGHAEFSSRIRAAVSFAGVFDFISRLTEPEQIALQSGIEEKKGYNAEWIGEPFAPDGEHWRRASAITHVHAGAAPMLLLHCEDDPIVPWLQAPPMYERMRAAGVHVEMKIYDTGGHSVAPPPPDDSMAEMVAFFRKML